MCTGLGNTRSATNLHGVRHCILSSKHDGGTLPRSSYCYQEGPRVILSPNQARGPRRHRIEIRGAALTRIQPLPRRLLQIRIFGAQLFPRAPFEAASFSSSSLMRSAISPRTSNSGSDRSGSGSNAGRASRGRPRCGRSRYSLDRSRLGAALRARLPGGVSLPARRGKIDGAGFGGSFRRARLAGFLFGGLPASALRSWQWSRSWFSSAYQCSSSVRRAKHSFLLDILKVNAEYRVFVVSMFAALPFAKSLDCATRERSLWPHR